MNFIFEVALGYVIKKKKRKGKRKRAGIRKPAITVIKNGYK